MREGKHIEKIINKTYDEALNIEDMVEAWEYFNKTFNGLEKAGYDVSEHREDAFDLVMNTILDGGEEIAKNQREYEGLRKVGDSFKRIEDAGYDISEYKIPYIYMFEYYTGLNITEPLDE